MRLYGGHPFGVLWNWCFTSRGARLVAEEQTRRLFFALWPHHALQTALAAITRDVVLASGGRPVPPENFHVTLVFLGMVAGARVADVMAIATDVARGGVGGSLEVAFDAIEYWKKPKVICATARSPAWALSPPPLPSQSRGPSSSPSQPQPQPQSQAPVSSPLQPQPQAQSQASSSQPQPPSPSLPSEGAPPAHALASALKCELTAAGFTPDPKPFRPHVTLARKVPPGTPDRAMQSVLWSCAEFALVESRTGPGGSSYSVLNSWPLCAADAQNA